MNVAWSLTGHVKTHDLGVVFAAETEFKTTSDPDTVRAPDWESFSKSVSARSL
jgi:hypothetical protein